MPKETKPIVKVKKEKVVTSKKSATLSEAKPATVKRSVGLSIPAISITGADAGTISLAPEVFGASINKVLLAQALRVYENNQTGHFSHTKTRGEVEGSTRKIFQQKGTGRARHGGIRAPIFVGGGIALGPKSRKTTLKLPQKMRKIALASALSAKVAEKEVMALVDLDKVSGKTKQISNLLNKISKKSVLFITDGVNSKAYQAIRNIQKTNILPVGQINAYEVLKYQTILITQEAAKSLTGGKKDA